jgi:glycosyltransferase involved in cell wall biosynthesis
VHRNLHPGDEELRRLFECADVFVMPTHGDGLPLVILEAMAAGLPVVTTSIGGIADAVVPGETGFLLEPRDVDTLVALLQRLTDSPAERRAIGMQGLNRAKASYDERTNGAALLASLKRVADTAARPQDIDAA